MGHVFINYNPKDKELAREVASSLKEKGVLTWLDILNILPGSHWYTSIDNAISNADVVVLLLSERDLQNIQLTEEYLLSGLENIKTIIVTSGNLTCSQIPQKFAHYDCVDSNQKNYLSQLIHLLPNSVKSESIQPISNKDSAKGYIFISYSLEDIGFVLKLRDFLAQKGYAYWD